MQERCNSIAKALELRLSGINPLRYGCKLSKFDAVLVTVATGPGI